MHEENYAGSPRVPVQNDLEIKKKWNAALKRNISLLAFTVVVNLLIWYLMQLKIMEPLKDWIVGNGFLGITEQVYYELYTIVMYLLGFGLPYLFYAKLVRFKLHKIPHDAPYVPVLVSCTGIAMALSIVGLVLSVISVLLFAFLGLYPNLSAEIPTEPVAYLLYCFNTTFMAAFVEELIYRGIILGSLRKYGDWFALVVSTLLFSLMHRNMVQIPNTLVVGFVIGYMMMKTNSIWTGIVIHFFNNGMALLLSKIESDSYRLLVQLGLYALYIIIAVAGCIYLFSWRKLDLGLYKHKCPLRGGAVFGRFFTNVPMWMMMALFIWVISLSFTRDSSIVDNALGMLGI